MDEIRKDMLIADIIGSHPELAPYIMDYGVHCIGCGASSFETLEEGFAIHGMLDEDIDAIVAELNDVIKKARSSLAITQSAASKIKELAASEHRPSPSLRIRAVGNGSTHEISFDFDNTITMGDKVIEDKGITIIVDKESMDYIKDSVLDYYKTVDEEGFSLERPKA